MKVTLKEKAVYDFFISLGIEGKAIVNFILGARKAPMYASIFHITGLDKKLKTELSKIYHHKSDLCINGVPARDFISDTWDL